MNNYTQEAINLKAQNHRNWGYPLIEGLEKEKEHFAISWVNKIITSYVENSNHPKLKEWINWLEELKEISNRENYKNIDYLNERGRYIFNAPPARNVYLILISHLYAAEGYYRLGNYKMYIRYLWDILDHVNDEFGDENSPEYKIIIKKYPII